MNVSFSGLQPDVRQNAAVIDKDPSQMLGNHFNLSEVNRTIVGYRLKQIYTNTTFQNNIGAFVRVK